MTEYQMAISRMKNDLLDLWINQSVNQSYYDWYKALIAKFEHYFKVRKAEFFMYNKTKEKFLPMQKDLSVICNVTPIAYELLTNHSKQLCIQQLQKLGYEDLNDFVVFENKLGEPLGLLLIQSENHWFEFSKTPHLTEFKVTMSRFLESIHRLNGLVLERRKFKLLFNFTEMFNSTMASEMILDYMIETIENLFPTFSVELILSREQAGMKHSYKVFNQLTERASTIDSFLKGVVTTEAKDNHSMLINAPIKGRQGVYGVLQLTVLDAQLFTLTQKDLIQMIASTAGSALENASLYNQSHQLIDELQLINETSRTLNSGLPFDEMIAYLKRQLSKVLSPNEIVFAFYDDHQQYELKASSSVFFDSDEGQKYLQYVSNYIQEGQESLFDANFGHAFSCETTYKSVIGLPITNQEEIIGFVVCLHAEKYSFSFDSFKLMQSIMMHASLSIANLQLRDRLQELSEKDYLTGLYARRYIDHYIDRTIIKGDGGTLLLLDVDDFKAVNDQYGHDVGDYVLKQIAQCIIGKLRGEGVAARWGGEEFAIYLPKSTREATGSFIEELLANVPRETSPPVTVSIGCVHWEMNTQYELKNLFKEVDFALYQAKEEGKNCLVARELAYMMES